MRYITVDSDRYGGCYSGASFTAWDGEPPDEIDAADGTCDNFWKTNTIIHGKGSTAEEAIQDLVNKLDIWICNFELVYKPSWTTYEDRIVQIRSERFKELYPNINIDE